MIEAYLRHEQERNAQGIPALPLNPEQAADLCKLLQAPPAGQEDFLMNLITERVSPGVDPAAEVKADFLGDILAGKASSPLISKLDAVKMLGTMIGGYNVKGGAGNSFRKNHATVGLIPGGAAVAAALGRALALALVEPGVGQ